MNGNVVVLWHIDVFNYGNLRGCDSYIRVSKHTFYLVIPEMGNNDVICRPAEKQFICSRPTIVDTLKESLSI